MTDYGRGKSQVTRFLFCLNRTFGNGEATHFKFRVLIDKQEY